MADEEKKHDVDYTDPEQEAQAQTTGLADVQVVKGTEGEVPLYKERVKLFRFRDNQWKERGIGYLRLMRNNETKRIRVVMRQEKTKKPVANFNVDFENENLCKLTPMANSDKAWMWICNDFSDGEASLDKLAAKFQNATLAKEFETAFNAARTYNEDAKAGKDVVEAPVIEDVEEAEVDDIDVNQTADKDGE